MGGVLVGWLVVYGGLGCRGWACSSFWIGRQNWNSSRRSSSPRPSIRAWVKITALRPGAKWFQALSETTAVKSGLAGHFSG
jgi:hypothetical protein